MKWKQITAFILSAFLTISLCAPTNGTLSVNVSAAESSDVIFSEEGKTGEESLTEEPAGSSMDGSTFDGSSEEAPMGSGSDETAGTGEDGEYEEEPALDDGSTEADSSVYDEDTASDDTTSPVDQETEDSSSPSMDGEAPDDSSPSEDGSAGDVGSPDAPEVSDASEVSDTLEDSETAQEGAEGSEAADDQNLIREFEDDVIVGFDEPGEADTISLEYKISLPALREMLPKQLVIWLGGAVHYEEGEDGALVPVNAEGYTAQDIDVEWSCVENYDESLECFHFVPVLEGYTLAEGIVLPEITVQIEGEFEAPPLTEFEKTAYDDFEVPIIGAVDVDGSPILRGTLPARYDAYAEKRLPPVRNQGNYGMCWAHGTIGSIEADLIADGKAGTDIDLSELHLAYFMSNEYYDEKNCNVGDTITTTGSFLKGGNERSACNLLAGMVGPALETDVPYSLENAYDPDPADGRGLGTVQLTGVYKINSMDLDAVKNAIILHGGVDTSYCENKDCYSSTYNSYYYPKERKQNHTVMLVGWDDSFPRTSFIAGTPEQNGAWLVRNSWGYDGYDRTGYFWISYYDKSLDNYVLAMDAQTSRYDHCYAYDSIPFIAGFTTDIGAMSGTQVFTVDGQEQIQAVGIQTVQPTLDIEISLECGKKSVSTSTSTGYPGYYLIPLDNPLTIARRSEVTLTVTYRGDGDVTIPTERATDYRVPGSVYHPNCGSGGMILKEGDDVSNTGRDSCFRLFTMDDLSLPVNMSALDVGLSQVSYVYDGNEKKPAVTVKNGSILLEEDVDYSVEYRDNINAGTAAVILTGLGDYEGNREESFTIKKAAPSLSFKNTEVVKKTTDGSFTNTLTKTTDGAITYASNNTSVAVVNASSGKVTIKRAGTAVITASAAAGQNYSAGKASYVLTINAVDIKNSKVVFPNADYTYNGKAFEPAPVVTLNGIELVSGTDYKTAYRNNVNAGTATITINGTGSYTGTKTADFKINKAAQSITAKAAASSVAVGKTTTVSITGAKGTKSYKSSDTTIATVTSAGKVTAKKVGTVRITATSAATSNYNAASKTVTIKVLPAVTSSLTASNQATGIKLTWKKVSGATGYKVYRNSTLIKTITNGSIVTYTDAKANTNMTRYIYKVVAKGPAGDSPFARTVTAYRVNRPALSSVTNSAASMMTVKWTRTARATGYQIKYSTSKTFASDNGTVSAYGGTADSRRIADLKRGKTYYVKIRAYKVVGNALYWSEWSPTKTVRISK